LDEKLFFEKELKLFVNPLKPLSDPKVFVILDILVLTLSSSSQPKNNFIKVLFFYSTIYILKIYSIIKIFL
jgi:hypothetical protein